MTRRAVVLASLIGAAISCIDPLESLPLEIDLQASRATAAPGDTINFLVIAQGGSLVNATIDYADGSDDQFAPAGARTAHITFRHAYSVTGNFRVHASVADVSGEQKTDSIDVIVR